MVPSLAFALAIPSACSVLPVLPLDSLTFFLSNVTFSKRFTQMAPFKTAIRLPPYHHPMLIFLMFLTLLSFLVFPKHNHIFSCHTSSEFAM
jgi:hypothetical protein